MTNLLGYCPLEKDYCDNYGYCDECVKLEKLKKNNGDNEGKDTNGSSN